MFDVKSMAEVFKIINENFSSYTTGIEACEIFNAAGRTIARDITSEEDIPAFHRSTVDGYAVIAADTFGASDSIPAQLKLAGEVKMGETPTFSLKNGEAAAIPTGGELPENADSVVMVEYTDSYDDGFIYINKSAAPGNGVIFRGDDSKKGSIIVKKGAVIRPQEVGILSAAGFSSVEVVKRLKIGIISTGDEVVPAGSSITGAQVRDVNSPMLYAGIGLFGAEAVNYGIVKDNYDEISALTAKALDECDIVLLSGGSSVGERDQTAKVIAGFGEPGILVHGIAIKPGKPTIIGKVKGKAIFGLPGHPASAYMIFRIFVCYLIDLISGRKPELFESSIKDSEGGHVAEMTCNYPSNNGRDEFIPVSLHDSIIENASLNVSALDKTGSNKSGNECRLLERKLYAKPVFGKSGLVSMLAAADGFVHIPRSSEGLQKGQKVRVFKW